MGDAIYISHQHIIFSKGEKTMNWDNLLFVWDEILAFFDKTFQWLKFLFTEGKWPQPPFPDIDAQA